MLKSIHRLLLIGIIAILALGGYFLYGLLWIGRRLMIKRLYMILTVLLVLLLGVVGSAVWAFNYYFMPMSGVNSEKVQVTIERGTSARAIAEMLEAKGVVRSSRVLLLWLRHTETADKIQAGRFTFLKGEGALNASGRLLEPQHAAEQTITVREGLTIEQTAARIAELIGIDSAAFVDLCLDPTFIASVGINAKSLEGYLFPDTYRLPENVTPEAIIRRMVGRFHDVYSTVEFDPVIKEKYNQHQIITLAAIVEKEATLAAERGRIAGVFHNRLRLGWPLGADPTVRYIFRKFTGPLRVSELNSPDPYNTRRFAGLPPGPICSPGLGAIRATAKPDTTSAMFFVALRDGSGAHHFSITNAEHDRKKLKIRAKRGIAE
jgi:UPF0755 protein